MRHSLFALLLLGSLSCGLQQAQVSSSAAVDEHSAHMSAADLRAPVITPTTTITSQGTPRAVSCRCKSYPETPAS